ncbi:ABC transporter permease [Thermosphaera chiliense]|uniref:ABC transporter permease n=1 Tax=Thermosphaera chiliense TaxID=3402707 RepID=A0A7M1USJ3_9CREN|nr:ABC transporter permease [Thermosphaera aggregans]QOR94969.1 ABC transporter permease [Thermosphaera aggregans]
MKPSSILGSIDLSKLEDDIVEVVFAVLAGFAISGLLMAAGGFDPIRAYVSLFKSAFGDLYGVSTTLSFATPLMLTGAAFAVSVRAGVFNIGAEGQVYMAALGAVIVASLSLPSELYLIAEFLFGVLLAITWASIAGFLKSQRGVNEVVSTIMLNWTGFWIVEYGRTYVYFDPAEPQRTIKIPEAGRLPLLVPGTELYAGIIISLVATVVVYVIMWHTSLGYEIRATGLNPIAARYGGVEVRRSMLYSFIIAGSLAGLAGVMEVAGRPPHYAITTGLSNLVGLGFDGLAVSLIGRNHPLAIIPAAIFVGALTAGSRGMQIESGVPLEMVKAVQGIIILILAVPGLVRMLKQWRGKK